MNSHDDQGVALPPSPIEGIKKHTDKWKRRVEEAWDKHIALCDMINEVMEQNMEKLRKSVEAMKEQGEA